MNKLYYRGKAYDYRKVVVGGERVYALLSDGQTVEHVKEEQLDIRSRVSLILDAYYTSSRTSTASAVLG
jgi:hypothetical protein